MDERKYDFLEWGQGEHRVDGHCDIADYGIACKTWRYSDGEDEDETRKPGERSQNQQKGQHSSVFVADEDAEEREVRGNPCCLPFCLPTK